MSLQRDVHHGVRIGRAEFVRSFRGYLGNTRRLIGLGIAVLFFGGSLLFALPTAYLLGRTARSATAIPFFGPAASAVPVVLVLLAVLRTLERIGSIEAEDLVLTTVHPRAVVIGLITAEIGRLLLWFGLPLGAFAAAFALGLGAPVLVVTGGLVTLPLVCCAAVWGYTGGLGILRLLRQLPAVRRLLKIGGVLVMVGIVIASQFVGQYIVEVDHWIQWLLSMATSDPLVDYVALAFIGTPLAQPTSVRSIAVLGAILALTPIGLAVATKQASALWFTDAPPRNASNKVRRSSGGFTAPQPFAWTNAGRIAWGVLVRARRRPQELSHLVMILFFIGPVGTTVVQSSADAIGVLIAGTGVGLGTFLAGATFGLNPLGDDRPQLPLLLLTTTSPRAFVRGRLLAGIAVGLPIAVLIPLASVGLGTPVLRALAFAGAGIGTCLAAATFALGIGAAYPIYEEREFWGTETVVPSTIVMIGYLFIVGAGTVLGLLVTWFAVTGNLVLTPVFLVGFGVYLLLTGGVPYGAYRYAMRRYRRYTFD
jgi:ABC-2 type transport system permease protein